MNPTKKFPPQRDAVPSASLPTEGKPLLLYHVLISVMGDGASSAAIALQRPWESVWAGQEERDRKKMRNGRLKLYINILIVNINALWHTTVWKPTNAAKPKYMLGLAQSWKPHSNKGEPEASSHFLAFCLSGASDWCRGWVRKYKLATWKPMCDSALIFHPTVQ